MFSKTIVTALVLFSGSAFANDQDMARKAKNQISDFVFQIPGANSVGVGYCGGFWDARALGEAVPEIVEPQYIGVSIGFESKEALKTFATTTRILGDKVTVIDQNGRKVGESRICGSYNGPIIIQPGRGVSNQ